MRSRRTPDSAATTRSRRSRRIWPVGVLVFAAVGAAAFFVFPREPKLPGEVTRAEYEDAERLFRQSYGRTPTRIDAISVIAELAVRGGRLATAAACFREIPSDHPQYGLAARLQEGQILVRLRRVREAERSLREFLSHAAGDPSVPGEHLLVARKWLAYLLSVELRLEEREPILADMHASGQADVYDSKQLHFPTLLIWSSAVGRQRLTEFLSENPDDPQLNVALARYRTAEGKLDEAQALLERLRERRPDDLDCAAALLERHFEADDWEAFAETIEAVPGYREGEPRLLTHLRGQFALHEKRWADAVRHLERLLSADPANPACHMGLARAYAGMGRREAREETLRRSLVLAEIRVDLVNVTEDDPAASRKLASACERAGLAEAAETFRRHAARIERAGGRAARPARPE